MVVDLTLRWNARRMRWGLNVVSSDILQGGRVLTCMRRTDLAGNCASSTPLFEASSKNRFCCLEKSLLLSPIVVYGLVHEKDVASCAR